MKQISPRLRLSPELRKRVIRVYVERYIIREKKIPTKDHIVEAIGGDVYTILEVLSEFRNDPNVNVSKNR